MIAAGVCRAAAAEAAAAPAVRLADSSPWPPLSCSRYAIMAESAGVQPLAAAPPPPAVEAGAAARGCTIAALAPADACWRITAGNSPAGAGRGSPFGMPAAGATPVTLCAAAAAAASASGPVRAIGVGLFAITSRSVRGL